MIHAATVKAYTRPAKSDVAEPNRARLVQADVTALLVAVQARNDPGAVQYEVSVGREDTPEAADVGDCEWLTAFRGLVQEEYLDAVVVLPLVLQALFAPGSSVSVWLPRDAPDHAGPGGAPVKINVTEFGPSGHTSTVAVRHKVFGSPGEGPSGGAPSHHVMLSTYGDMLFKKARVTDDSLTWLESLNHYAPLVLADSGDLLAVGRRLIHGALGFDMARHVTAQLAESVFGQPYVKEIEMEDDALAVATKISNTAAGAVQAHTGGASGGAPSAERTNLIIVALDPLLNGPLLFVSSVAAVMSCLLKKLRAADPNGKSEIDKISAQLRAGAGDGQGIVDLLNRQQFREVLIAAAKESHVNRERIKAESMATGEQPSEANGGASTAGFGEPSLVERLRQSQNLSAAASGGLTTTDEHRALAQLTLACVIQVLPALRDAVAAKGGTAAFFEAITRMGMQVEICTMQALQQDLINNGGTVPSEGRLRNLCHGVHKNAMQLAKSATTNALRLSASSDHGGARDNGILVENMISTSRVRTATTRLAESQEGAAAPPHRIRTRNRSGKGKGKGKGKAGTSSGRDSGSDSDSSAAGAVDGAATAGTWPVHGIVDFVADWDNSRLLVVVDWGTQKDHDAATGRLDAVSAAWAAARGSAQAAQTSRYTLEHKMGVSTAQWGLIVNHASFSQTRREFDRRQDAEQQVRSREPSSSPPSPPRVSKRLRVQEDGDGERQGSRGVADSTSSPPPPLLNADDTNKVISQLRAMGNGTLANALAESLAKQAEAAK